jgi:hypothetical protein
MARPEPITFFTPAPGVIQLEDDNSAPLLAPEHLAAIALNAKGKLEAELANNRIVVGHLTSLVCALVQMLKDNPDTASLVIDDMLTIPAALANRVEGLQLQCVTVGDGDVGVIVRERAPELVVIEGLNG